MTMLETYEDFLRSKVQVVRPAGFEPASVNEALFDFQRDIVRWALRKGRAAVFAGTGLGKSAMQLEWANQVAAHTGGNALILAPLAVAQQTVREGEKFGVQVNFCREQAQVQPGITITNYEMLSKFDPKAFAGVVLDESSILKAHDGKTRKLITDSFAKTQYRLACTATPAPNDHMELGTHAEFLGVMTRAEMLSMFFVHDGGDTSKWRLKRHARGPFWEWVASWATMISHPRDLGYETAGYDLPDLHIVNLEVPQEPTEGADYAGLMGRRRARKESLQARCHRAAELINFAIDRGPWLVWCDLNAESELLTRLIVDAVEITGSDSSAEKERKMLAFAAGEIHCLVTKPSIAGYGLNWQNCSKELFVGLSDSFEDYYQAVRRCWRFGQQEEVSVYVITGELEGPVVENIKRKEAEFKEMQANMIAKTQELTKANVRDVQSFRSTYRRDCAGGEAWTLYLGDCVEVLREMPAKSMDFSIFSPPFSSLYVYSDSERDMGNCLTDAQFYEHMGFLASELFRVMKPGRNLSFHCMNLPMTKERDGVIGIRDFRGDLIRIFQKAGFIYHSEVTIWKNPVTAMQRTKAIGLLHKQLKKDSCISRQGIPDYLVTMRMPGVNPEPCSKTNESFPVSEWQEYASPVWMDIKESKTLQRKSARAEEDERHICPLQLEVIERALRLWSNEGDIVLSPFAGIGSEGHVALEMKRRFVGIELKPSYFEQAEKNLRAKESEVQALLF